MKKHNIRNTIIGTVIALAILAIPVVLLLLNKIAHPAPTPNEHFGNIEAVYSSRAEIPITDLEGDTDILTIDALCAHYPDNVYREYVDAWPTGPIMQMGAVLSQFDRSPDPSAPPAALMMHLRATLPKPGYYNVFGSVERMEDGEWVRIGSLFPADDLGNNGWCIHGEQLFHFPFPIHESGTYRLNYSIAAEHDDSRIYTVSHTLTIPEPSGKKFDVITADIGYERLERYGIITIAHDGYTVSVLCRTNVGGTLYQLLRATRVEKLVGGEWLEIDGDDDSYVVELTDPEAEPPGISPAMYPAEHPFTGETTENLFCGTAKFMVEDTDSPYRLTLVFCENADGSGERYALQLVLDLS